MNAPVATPISSIEREEAVNMLRLAREVALSNAAVHRGSWVGDIGALIADIANNFMFSDAPLIAIEDAQTAIKHLQRAQRIAGHLDGTYPTERYREALKP